MMEDYLDGGHDENLRPQSMAVSINALPPPPRGPITRRTHSPQSSTNPPPSRAYFTRLEGASSSRDTATALGSGGVGIPPNRVFKFQATSSGAAGTAAATATSTSTATGSWQQRRRPLISHGHHSNSVDSTNTTSTTASATSTDTITSSVDPAETAENGPRISISSTIYAASSDLSHDLHQHILGHEEQQRSSLFYDNHNYEDDEDDGERRQRHQDNHNQRERERERDSFMDLYSPLNLQFDDTDSSELNFNYLNADDDGDEASVNVPGSPIVFSTPGGLERERDSETEKPPLPTTPKPLFVRGALKANSHSNSNSRTGSPNTTTPPLRSHSGPPSGTTAKDDSTLSTRPPTTNFLDMDERAGLIRKSRKLTRVFGQTPGAEAMAQQQQQQQAESNKTARTGATFSLVDPSAARTGAGSIPVRPVSAWQGSSPPVECGYLLASSGTRRHSMPMTPDDVSFLSIASPTFPPTSTFGPVVSTPTAFDAEPSAAAAVAVVDNNLGDEDNESPRGPRAESPTSFMDLSDDEDTSARRRRARHRTQTHISAAAHRLSEQPSIDTLNAEIFYLEEERRRKRERLAKLHRFLGSRVPASLVFGLDEMSLENSLPPALTLTSGGVLSSSESEREREGARKSWIKSAGRKRRSSSVVGIRAEEGALERVREELDDKEKAINVRRAHKMEKVFGVAPPQTLYHTRHSAQLGSSSNSKPGSPRPTSVVDVSATTATAAGLVGVLTSSAPHTPTAATTAAAALTSTAATVSPAAAVVIKSNTHRASYMKTKTKKNGRPGTSESSKQLLPGGVTANEEYEYGVEVERYAEEQEGEGERVGLGYANGNQRHSFIYTHYQHSLKSLNDILDRDDRESLTELHEYLNNPSLTPTVSTPTGAEDTNPNSITASATAALRRISLSSLKSERRRSLPARTSFSSLAPSECTLSPPSSISSSTTDFQLRRRRAAKLAQFFGVNYRELITDVLESIESGVEQEQQKGTLRAEEVEDLLTKLRTLKTKRTGLF